MKVLFSQQVVVFFFFRPNLVYQVLQKQKKLTSQTKCFDCTNKFLRVYVFV